MSFIVHHESSRALSRKFYVSIPYRECGVDAITCWCLLHTPDGQLLRKRYQLMILLAWRTYANCWVRHIIQQVYILSIQHLKNFDLVYFSILSNKYSCPHLHQSVSNMVLCIARLQIPIQACSNIFCSWELDSKIDTSQLNIKIFKCLAVSICA